MTWTGRLLMPSKPHVWTMDRMEGFAQTAMAAAGYRPTIAPHCRFCGISTLDALKRNPENNGVGPCPKR